METGAGARCAHCEQLDFLPFVCAGCGKTLCKEHRSHASHGCETRLEDVGVMPLCGVCGRHVHVHAGESADAVVSEHLDSGCKKRLLPQDSRAPRKPCAAPGCKNERRFEVVRCKACHGTHCLTHRFPQDHACKGKRDGRAAKKMSPAAEALLARLAAKKEARLAAEAASGKKKKSKKGPPGLALRRVKMRAKGDAGVPDAQRFYLEVVPDAPGARPAKSQCLWFRRTWTVGRALGDACERFGVKNRNHEAGAPRLGLLHGGRALDTTAPLESLPGAVDGFEEGAEVRLGIVE